MPTDTTPGIFGTHVSITDDGADTLVTIGADTITLIGVDHTTVTQADSFSDLNSEAYRTVQTPR